MKKSIFQGSRARCGQGFADAPRGHSPFPFNNMDPGPIVSIIVHGPEGEPDRGGQAHARRASREAEEGGGRRWVAVERFGFEFQKERSFGDRIAAETKEA